MAKWKPGEVDFNFSTQVWRMVLGDGTLVNRGDMVALQADLNPYHERRRDSHGSLYIVVRFSEPIGGIIEAKSIATGRVCTLQAAYLESSNALRE